MDSVTAQIIMEGFEAIEKAVIALRDEVRSNHPTYGPTRLKTNEAFEELRAFMHDGPELDDDGTV